MVVRWRCVEEVEAGGAKGAGVELEDAGGAEAAVDASEADMVEENPAVVRGGGAAAVAAFGGKSVGFVHCISI